MDDPTNDAGKMTMYLNTYKININTEGNIQCEKKNQVELLTKSL